MFKITRINDGKSWEVGDYKFLTFENGRGKELINNPKIESALMLPPFNVYNYLWLTSPIKSIESSSKFHTKNSTYIIEKFCKKCDSYIEICNFYNDKSKKDGKHTICKSCHKLPSKVLKETKDFYYTNEDYKFKVISRESWDNVSIQFEDGTILNNRQFSSIELGTIHHPFHKSVCGVGYKGVGDYSLDSKAGSIWHGMLTRCCNDTMKIKYPSYRESTICEEWKCFQNFAEWYENNYRAHMEEWQLDKDILVKVNKVYSPDTCTLVPREINLLFIKNNAVRGDLPLGVRKMGQKFQARLSMYGEPVHLGIFNTIAEAFEAYKVAKERYIKELADKWKPLITPQTYQAMYNYQVEITD